MKFPTKKNAKTADAEPTQTADTTLPGDSTATDRSQNTNGTPDPVEDAYAALEDMVVHHDDDLDSDQEVIEGEVVLDQTTTGAAQNRIAELQDQYLRLLADFDNHKRRTAQDRLKESARASQDLVGKLLPVVDDFERTLETMRATEASGDSAAMAVRQGIELVHNKLVGILAAQGLETVEALGQAFDTDSMEAVGQEAAPGQEGLVVRQWEKGYRLGGQVLRYAKVVVGQ